LKDPKLFEKTASLYLQWVHENNSTANPNEIRTVYAWKQYLMEEEYPESTVNFFISHLKNYLQIKGTTFSFEEWKLLSKFSAQEAPSFTRKQFNDGFSKLKKDSPFSVTLRLYVAFAVAGLLRSSSSFEIKFTDVVLSNDENSLTITLTKEKNRTFVFNSFQEKYKSPVYLYKKYLEYLKVANIKPEGNFWKQINFEKDLSYVPPPYNQMLNETKVLFGNEETWKFADGDMDLEQTSRMGKYLLNLLESKIGKNSHMKHSETLE
jgi:hypothetical protein